MISPSSVSPFDRRTTARHQVDDCPLCGDIAGDPDASGVAQLYGPEALARSILWESDDLFLLPGPGTIAVGYLILATKKHEQSFARVRREALARVQALRIRLNDFAATLKLYPYIAFEHGSGGPYRRGAACVENAHIHFAPTPRPDEFRAMLRGSFNECEHTTIADIEALRDQAYLLLQTDEGVFSYQAPVAPSQFLRRLLAEQHNIPTKWNWHFDSMPDNFWRTLDLFQHFSL